MAYRYVSGDFGGSARKAARDPDCVRLGVGESTIRFLKDRIDPAAAAAHAADRARVAIETAAAEAAGVPVKFIFVERAGSAPAAAAIGPQWA